MIVRDIWEQVCGEWFNFEKDVRDEIKYLEQTVLESCSVGSKGSKLNRSIKSLKLKSSVDSEHSNKVDKYKLQQEEAALKVKLAYIEQEKALEIEKLIQEQKMEELKLKRDLELSRAKFEKEQMPSLEDDLANLPSEGKGEGVKRFLQSLPVTTSTSEASTSVQFQVSQTPAFTTTSTPKSTSSSLHATAPSFSPGAVTQSVFTVRHFDHGHSTVAHICHGKTYFSTAKLTFPRQNLLFHGKTYFFTAKLHKGTWTGSVSKQNQDGDAL